MKRFFVIIALASVFAAAGAGCSKKSVDYAAYISDMRSGIFVYEDDGISLAVHCSKREQPRADDGICGDICEICEVFAKFAKNPQTVETELGGYGGEMNYEAVNCRYVLSFSAPEFTGDGLDVKITADGEEKIYRLLNVKDGGVMSCESALMCAVEHDGELFSSLTDRQSFRGEIYVRLLFDEGCYYYVGVCDREHNLTAYLLDGNMGKVIASKKLKV